MKKLLALTLALLLCCAGCMVPTKQDAYNIGLIDRLQQAQVFSEPLEPLDTELIRILYGLDEETFPPDQLIQAAGICSAGATCEQALVLHFETQDSAETARTHLQGYLDQLLASNRSYRPAEVPKLEKAILSRRDNTVLFLVAADYDTAAKHLP